MGLACPEIALSVCGSVVFSALLLILEVFDSGKKSFYFQSEALNEFIR